MFWKNFHYVLKILIVHSLFFIIEMFTKEYLYWKETPTENIYKNKSILFIYFVNFLLQIIFNSTLQKVNNIKSWTIYIVSGPTLTSLVTI